NGKAMAVGANGNGQLGDGTKVDKHIPVLVSGSALYKSITAGCFHSAAMKCWTAAKAWGRGLSGELGIGSTLSKSKPQSMSGLSSGVLQVALGATHTLALKADGTVWATGDNTYGELGNGTNIQSLKPVRVPTLSDVIAVTAGSQLSYAIKSDGS